MHVLRSLPSSPIYILCAALPTNCSHGDIRVNNAFNRDELEGVTGRLEVCFNNVWFAICYEDYFLGNDRVMCKMLGYTTSGTEIHVHSP